MSMDDFMNHPIFMDPNHIPTQEEIDQSDILSSLQAMKYCDLGELSNWRIYFDNNMYNSRFSWWTGRRI